MCIREKVGEDWDVRIGENVRSEEKVNKKEKGGYGEGRLRRKKISTSLVKGRNGGCTNSTRSWPPGGAPTYGGGGDITGVWAREGIPMFRGSEFMDLCVTAANDIPKEL